MKNKVFKNFCSANISMNYNAQLLHLLHLIIILFLILVSRLIEKNNYETKKVHCVAISPIALAHALMLQSVM